MNHLRKSTWVLAIAGVMLGLGTASAQKPRPLDKLPPLQKKSTIQEKYSEFMNILGKPVSEEKSGAGGGKYRDFQYGSIYWHPSLGAFEVHGKIVEKYRALGAEKGTSNLALGYPTSDELKAADGRGRYSMFQHGVILWTPETGAHEVHGAILEKYKETKAYAGSLGYPVSDEEPLATVPGRQSRFEHGIIAWQPGTGASVTLTDLKLTPVIPIPPPVPPGDKAPFGKSGPGTASIEFVDWGWALGAGNSLQFYAVLKNIGTGPADTVNGETHMEISSPGKIYAPSWTYKDPVPWKNGDVRAVGPLTVPRVDADSEPITYRILYGSFALNIGYGGQQAAKHTGSQYFWGGDAKNSEHNSWLDLKNRYAAKEWKLVKKAHGLP